jgi:hypothetical protein
MRMIKPTLILLFSLAAPFVAMGAHAQVANDTKTQNALLAALPQGVTADTATPDQIAQAAIELAFGMEGDLEANVAQVTVALGVMNLASSNLDVSSSTYYALTVQDMTRLSAAVRRGQNFLQGATSNAITRK